MIRTGTTIAVQTAIGDKENYNVGVMQISPGTYRAGLTLIVCLAALTYCSLAIFWPKFSRAEVFFAECAREMLVTKNFVTPLYHGQPFFDKPILVYWLIICMFKTCGLSHFAARIPSILCALGSILLTAAGGTALYGRRSGLLAASALASSFMFLSFAGLCMSDMLLVFWDTLTLSLLFLGAKEERRRDRFWLGAAISMGLAFLTKGPIGVVLPMLTFLSFLAFTKKLGILRFRHAFYALVTIALISSPWFIAAYRANGIGALVYFFIHENLQRFSGAEYDAGKPFWYPIVSLFLGFAPWSVFLPLAFGQIGRAVRKDGLRPETHGLLFLWLWVVVSVGFFCFSRGKCDYYTLPAYPAAAILIAKYADDRLTEGSGILKAILAVFAVGFLICSCVSCSILMVCADATTAWWIVPISLLATGAASLALLAKNKLGSSCSITAFGIAATTIFFAAEVLPDIAAMEPIEQYASLLNATPTDTKIGVEQSIHGWIDEISFQTGRHPVTLKASEIANFLDGHAPAIVLMSEDRLKELPAQNRSALKILFRQNVVTHVLTPGYIIQRGGNLRDPVPVLMVASPSVKELSREEKLQTATYK